MKDKYFGAHEFQAREEGVKVSSERNFGLVFAGLFTLLGTLSFYHGGTHWYYWFPLAALFAVFAYAAPVVLAPLNRLWAKFGHLLQSLVPWHPVLLLHRSDRSADAAEWEGPDAAQIRPGGEELLDRPHAARPRAGNIQEPVLRHR
jgi:hypothetical protein